MTMNAQTQAVRRILLTGQCTLHWGRMEFGNIGNYYILEPLVRELHRVFVGAEIRTTFQLSREFSQRERVTVLPMDLYYGWQEDDLARAEKETAAARHYAATGSLTLDTPFIKEVLAADLVVDFSGDLWGDNAVILGPNRLQTGLCKDRTAQLLGKPVVLLAGSPGPFASATAPKFMRIEPRTAEPRLACGQRFSGGSCGGLCLSGISLRTRGCRRSHGAVGEGTRYPPQSHGCRYDCLWLEFCPRPVRPASPSG
jgi:hypothetical protein